MKKLIYSLLIVLTVLANINAQPTRKVLFEEGTNASCGPCAASNPILIAWLQNHQAQAISIMYHASWPGVDPMYQANPTQSTERIQYNNISAVPTCNVDGIIYDIWPFTNAAFDNAYNTRLAVTPPLSIDVIDQRIAGDSIKSTITLVVNTNLSAGTYRLRVMAVEKLITYSTPPGSNGETVFHTVFRRAYPNTTGVDCPTTAGTYNYTYTYKREAAWQDTSIATVVFVQNDVNKEVLNSNKGMFIPTGINNLSSEIPGKYSLEQNYPNPFNPSTRIRFALPKSGFTTLKVYDALGKEVSLLVNSKLESGSYEFHYNAAALSSGIYFYKLISGDYSEVKRMSLVK
ncbi:MAG: T9SS type A sorting domain-containing protein [Candidatus Kapaibacterium sp.]